MEIVGLGQAFVEHIELMTVRVIVEHGEHLIAQVLVKLRCLKAKGAEH